MSWLEVISVISIGIGIFQAIIITVDIIRIAKKMMQIMNIVWPLTGLYFPISGMWAYYSMGSDEGRSNHKDQHQRDNHHKNPFCQSAFVSTTHCSSGYSLGNVSGVPIVAF